MRIFQVGGSVRDEILGGQSKDIDYAVEAPSFEDMRKLIEDRGGKIFLESPEYFTIRANVPNMGVCDFVLCRKDGTYSDGRHPDSVEVGTIHDDLARRDFTMNAIAKDENGCYLDPYRGIDDIKTRIIRCVGFPAQRFNEDALRMLRAIRFSVVLGFQIHIDIQSLLQQKAWVDKLRTVSVERIREELHKMFKTNTYHSILTLASYQELSAFIFQKTDIWLDPTLKQK